MLLVLAARITFTLRRRCFAEELSGVLGVYTVHLVGGMCEICLRRNTCMFDVKYVLGEELLTSVGCVGVGSKELATVRYTLYLYLYLYSYSYLYLYLSWYLYLYDKIPSCCCRGT